MLVFCSAPPPLGAQLDAPLHALLLESFDDQVDQPTKTPKAMVLGSEHLEPLLRMW